MSRDDLCQAAADGDLEALSAAMKITGNKPVNPKSQTALVCAVAGNHIEAVRKLLDWSVTADSQDDQKRRALHLACSMGFAEITQLLLKRGADFKAVDSESMTALSVAVSNKQLQCAKALLRAGAKLLPNQTCTGLPKIVSEVQLDCLVDELKEFAASRPGIDNEMSEADNVVWEAQKHHMRLLTTREEQKAGRLVIDLDERLQSEMSMYSNAKKSEDALTKELADLRVNLQTVETNFGLMRSQVDSTEAAARRATEEENEADVEYKAMLGELSKTEKEKEATDRDIERKERERDEALAFLRQVQDEANEMKQRNKDLADELKAEAAELRGWERDKEAAAALTEKAHNLLGTGPLSPKSVRGGQVAAPSGLSPRPSP